MIAPIATISIDFLLCAWFLSLIIAFAPKANPKTGKTIGATVAKLKAAKIIDIAIETMIIF